MKEVLDDLNTRVNNLTVDSLKSEEGRAAIANLAEWYFDVGRYAESCITLREGWVSQFAEDNRAFPGKEFDKESRGRAESIAWANDSAFMSSLSDIRNSISHGGYGNYNEKNRSKNLKNNLKKRLDDFKKREADIKESKIKAVFTNLSNHPSNSWSDNQRNAALELAHEIQDLSFPAVDADADESQIRELAKSLVNKIPANCSSVLVQGEFTLSFALVQLLKNRGINCYAATSKRHVVEHPNGVQENVLILLGSENIKYFMCSMPSSFFLR